MPRLGRHPTWLPTTVGDRVLTGVLTAAYVWFYAPVQLVTWALGWTRINWVFLDLISFPGAAFRGLGRLFGERGRQWGLKANALEHTYLVCRLCPLHRQAQRDPSGGQTCVWNANWNRGNFGIEPDFGPVNWARQYASATDLADYTHLRELPERTGRQGQAPLSERPGLLWTLSIAVNALFVYWLIG